MTTSIDTYHACVQAHGKTKAEELLHRDRMLLPAIVAAAQLGKPLPRVSASRQHTLRFVECPALEVQQYPLKRAVQKPILAALEPVCSVDAHRSTLWGVFFEEKSQVAVASDGKIMVVVRTKVDKEVLLASRKLIWDKQEIQAGAPIPALYPYWRSVVPDLSNVTPTPLDVQRTRQACEVAYGIHKTCGLPLYDQFTPLVTPTIGIGTHAVSGATLRRLVNALLHTGATKLSVRLPVRQGLMKAHHDPGTLLVEGDNGSYGVIGRMKIDSPPSYVLLTPEEVEP